MKLKNTKRKTIYFDAPTLIFLASIKEERKKLQLSTKQAATIAGMSSGNWSNIENLKRNPSLTTLIKIADVLNYDLSESLNYKIYKDKITLRKIREGMKKYGITINELAKLLNFTRRGLSFHLYHNTSVPFLCSAWQVIKQEEKRAKLRRK